jgi:hypothetical protein
MKRSSKPEFYCMGVRQHLAKRPTWTKEIPRVEAKRKKERKKDEGYSKHTN